MFATLGLVLAAQLNLAPPSVCTAAETRAALSVSKTVSLIDFTLGEDAPLPGSSMGLELARPAFLRPPPSKARLSLHLPRLSLGWLAEVRFTLGFSLSSVVGNTCALALLTAPEVTPVHTVLEMPGMTRLDLGPRVDLSLLAPWYGLLSRLGHDPEVHGNVSVSTGVMMGTTVGGGYAGQPVNRGPSASPGTASSAPARPVAVQGPSVRVPTMQTAPTVRTVRH